MNSGSHERAVGTRAGVANVARGMSATSSSSRDFERHYGTTPFARLALAHGASMMGDACVTVALAGSLFFTVRPGEARPKVLLYLILTVAPFGIVGPVIGPALDRTRGGRRTLVALGMFLRFVLSLYMATYLHSLLLFPLAFGALVLSKGHAVAKAALVPAVVRRDDELVGANSRLGLISVIAVTLGSIPAVALLNLAGSEWALRFGAVVFAGGGVLALRIPRAPRVAPDESPEQRAELHSPSIVLAATAMGVLRGGVGFLTFLVAFELKRQHQPTWFFGAAIAAGALGGLVAVLLAPWLRRKTREELMLVGSLLAPAIVGLLAARSSGRWSFMLMSFVVAVGAGAGRVGFDSLVQRDGPDELRGRDFARFETRFQLTWVIGALIPVALLEVMNARLGFVVLAIVLGFAGLSYLAGLRAVRDKRWVPRPTLTERLRAARRRSRATSSAPQAESRRTDAP